jgi:hypothetical protein
MRGLAVATALQFAENGPYKLEDLLVDKEERSFSSFAAIKKVEVEKFYGPAGDGWEYHHIVEQNQEGTIPASEINSTRNVIRIPKLLHEEINYQFAQKDEAAKLSLREVLRGKSFDAQWEAGVTVLQDVGVVCSEGLR